MQRAVATILFVLFSWMLAISAFASPADATMPACCRKNGQHHCGLKTQTTSVAVVSKCPCSAFGAATMHIDGFAPTPSEIFYAGVASHPAGCPQTDANYRISSLRSHQKRGPPPSLCS
jgi:NaMN:DMB phosphoribosyltransferase